MSRTVQKTPGKITTVQLKKPESVLVTEPEPIDTDIFVENMVEKSLAAVKHLRDENDKLLREKDIMTNAIRMLKTGSAREVSLLQDQIKGYETQIMLIEQELETYRGKQQTKTANRANVQKTIDEVCNLVSHQQAKKYTKSELDDETKNYLKQFN